MRRGDLVRVFRDAKVIHGASPPVIEGVVLSMDETASNVTGDFPTNKWYVARFLTARGTVLSEFVCFARDVVEVIHSPCNLGDE